MRPANLDPQSAPPAAMTANLAPFAWSLLLAAGVVVFSTVPLGAARSQATFQMEDLAAPRAMFERLNDSDTPGRDIFLPTSVLLRRSTSRPRSRSK